MARTVPTDRQAVVARQVVVARRAEVDRLGVLTAHTAHMVLTGRMVPTDRVAAITAHMVRTVPAAADRGDRMARTAVARAVPTARTAAQVAR